MKFFQKAAVAALASVFVATAAFAADGHKSGHLSVSDGWARASATPAAKAGAAYVNLGNTGSKDDVLVGGTSPVAKRVEIHVHKHEGGVMKMLPAGDVTIPAGGEVTMEPGGLHVMLMGLKKPLKEGEMFPVTLTFQHAGDVTVSVMTMGVAAKGPKGGMVMPTGRWPWSSKRHGNHELTLWPICTTGTMWRALTHPPRRAGYACMQRWKLTIEYDGGPFVGWQRQDNGMKAFQQRLEEAAEALAGCPTPVQGAGRTDPGVHAWPGGAPGY